MTPELSEDLRRALGAHPGAPVYVVDPATDARYVLIRAEEFESLRAAAGEPDAEAMYPLVADIDPEDWEDASHYGLGPS